MVILEPIQGENGVVVPPPGYLAAAREITAAHGACWCWTRCRPASAVPATGSPTRPTGIEPDVVTLAKGLGGGLPIGACLVFGDAADLLGPGSHGSTFGGNPVSCAAALAVLATIDAEDLLDHVKRIGERLRRGIEALGHPLVAEVRGAGLLLGIVPHRTGVRRRSPTALRDGRLPHQRGPAGRDPARATADLSAEQVDAFVAALARRWTARTDPDGARQRMEARGMRADRCGISCATTT